MNSSQVHYREVVKRALNHNTATMVLASHPYGLAEPSQAVIENTRWLQDALKLVEVVNWT
ncbi:MULTISPECIES: JAB domain-containing protein [Aeromonas]|uniref:JAB domain-containing protein n=1 Tax=Aeromonas caviae TaxID=648 RepID=A0AAF0GCS2_AERCA|nr:MULTISPECIES: JAB domain-containing protein [Aeromonas]MDH0434786.1 hypothetical protein [Aeromonas caviae]MDH0937634.1 hypothetical protein [Aeromonas caviae]MDH1398445.1 hypothetical protein [Aeromonas caviae]MDH1850469.1 hypothetical protein [Aeromonas caviae]QQM75199.1 hypothetical protein JH254_17495 [Aeromonas caviae]